LVRKLRWEKPCAKKGTCVTTSKGAPSSERRAGENNKRESRKNHPLKKTPPMPGGQTEGDTKNKKVRKRKFWEKGNIYAEKGDSAKGNVGRKGKTSWQRNQKISHSINRPLKKKAQKSKNRKKKTPQNKKSFGQHQRHTQSVKGPGETRGAMKMSNAGEP